MTLSYIPSDTNDEGIFKANASGSLPNGKPVIVNADGTVSVVSGVDGAVGSKAEYNPADTRYPTAVYDTGNSKVVFVYQDDQTPNARVGTVSGTSISFGSEVRFQATFGATAISTVYDPDTGKIVVAYVCRNEGRVVIGTVSGTGISFGTPVVFHAGSTDSLQGIKAVYDTANDKVVIAYQDAAVARGQAIVGAVSGTSISFGSAVEFSNNQDVRSEYNTLTMAFDSTAGKVIIAYANGSKGYATVGTVSGSSISFATPVEFASQALNYLAIDYDSVNNKSLIFYNAGAAAGKAIVVTLSGTTPSYGTAATFKGSNSGSINAVYDSAAGLFVFTFSDVSSSNDGKLNTATISGTSVAFGSETTIESGVYDYPGIGYDSENGQVIALWNNGVEEDGNYLINKIATTNLTSENYIGISTGGTYASGSNATIKIIGNTSNEQSSLTAGQSYFVQTDGTLGLTAADPSVFAGTAVSATKLLVKT